MANISFDELKQTLYDKLIKYEFDDSRAALLSKIYAETTLDGINSHGVNRFPLFIKYVVEGHVNKDAEPELIKDFGPSEQWDGNHGPGIFNAWHCMNRAIELARKHSVGLVALRNNNHWMRGGTYGWQAAEEGMMAICFTNTVPIMPAWGGKQSVLGNNPFVMAFPREKGHIVLDMSMSQYSYGRMHEYKMRGDQLPFTGGWDENDELTNDPLSILKTERALPIGYWKGAALATMLDIFVTALSGGDSTSDRGLEKVEKGVSQLFICIDPTKFGDPQALEQMAQQTIDYIHNSGQMKGQNPPRYPGESTIARRDKNLKEGMQIDEKIWAKVLGL